jgi:hypothetical protein
MMPAQHLEDVIARRQVTASLISMAVIRDTLVLQECRR